MRLGLGMLVGAGLLALTGAGLLAPWHLAAVTLLGAVVLPWAPRLVVGAVLGAAVLLGLVFLGWSTSGSSACSRQECAPAVDEPGMRPPSASPNPIV